MKRLLGMIALPLLLPLLSTASEPDVPTGRKHRVYFADTDKELNVYEISGREAGPTLLIIGGIHGNEPGGYLAADLFADLTLKKGNLIVVPRANIYSIQQNERGSRGDMNRQFSTESHDLEIDSDIIGVLVELMRQADALLNLHDGSGFYSPEWIDDLQNPLRWGQTVIIDTASLTTRGGERVDLEAMAGSVVARANGEIPTPAHHFRVKNTNTFNEDSPHLEQRGSATFFAISEVGIPAFGVETSKQIVDEAERVEHQVLVINAFMEGLGILPDHPRFALETPQLEYITVSVDGGPPVVIESGQSHSVHPGATIKIAHVEANYERGLVVDIEGVGDFNDRGIPVVLVRDTRVVVRKDKYDCGQVWLRVDPSADRFTGPDRSGRAAGRPAIDAFRVAVNGSWHYLPSGESLQVVRGDELQLGDPLGVADLQIYQVNLRGFVGNQVANDGEDRGYPVHTEHDLLQRFSLSPEKERYEIRIEQGRDILATSIIEVTDPILDYVLMRLDDGPLLAMASGDTLAAGGARHLLIENLVTLPRDASRFTVNFRGFAGSEGAEDRGQSIDLQRSLLTRFSLEGSGRFYEITVSLGSVQLGRVVLDLGSPHLNSP
jgi:hypothetical protein